MSSMKGFKKCANGHFYKEDLAQCPYCQGQGRSNTDTMNKGGNDENTQVFSGFNNDDGNGSSNSNKTIIIDEKNPRKTPSRKADTNSNNRTIFEDEFEEETEGGGVVVKKERRTNRRLVGWLVTYSIDPLGIDYKIYEGRNMIGKHVDCNITVNDKKMTDKHALILFRPNKYIIQDQLSTHGTFVNFEEDEDGNIIGGDIECNPFELNDGDIIKMGNTVFKFKSSL